MIWFIIATLVAFFIKGLCGFVNTLIFNGILSYTANNINISPLEVVLGYPSNIILVWKERKSLNWKIWLPLTALVVAGSIPGIFLLKHTDAGLLKVIFGIAVIIIGIEMLFREMKSSKSSNKKVRRFQNCIGTDWNYFRSALRSVWCRCTAGGLCEQSGGKQS